MTTTDEAVQLAHGPSWGNRYALAPMTNFKARPQPVSRDVLRAEFVGPEFMDYFAAEWDDLVG